MNTRSPRPVTIDEPRRISLDELLALQQKEREIPTTLTHTDYTAAVTTLVRLANMDCGGSRIAAQVLLGTYNGDNWHMDLTELCNLSSEYYRAALIVIRCRVEICKEPHRMIDNGTAIFARLEKEWQSYHVDKRYQSRYQG
jgi:hypothetical protein